MNTPPAVYPSLLAALWNGTVDIGMTWKMTLIDGTYDYDPTDDAFADVTSAAIATTVVTGLAYDVSDPGVLKCDPVVWTTPPTAENVRGTVLWVDNAADCLAAYYGIRLDGRAVNITTDGTNFTYTPPSGRLLRI